MARRLVRRRAAEDDVAEQLTYLAGERPAVRARELKGVRVWPVPGFRRFLIFYRVTSKTVEVIRVLHSARDIRRVLERSS